MRREYLTSNKLVLLLTLLKLFILVKTPFTIKEKRTIYLLGHQVTFLDADKYIFIQLFIDIFIKSQYYFESHRNNPLILDLGSHIGLSIIYFKKLYPESEIYGYEASRDNFKLLELNIQKNNLNNVHVFNLAISDRNGKAKFYSGKEKGSSWSNSLDIDMVSESLESEVGICKASSITSQFDCIDLLKVDIEGEEAKVISNLDLDKQLTKITDMIIEYHQLRLSKSDLDNILAILKINNMHYFFDYFFKFKFHIAPPYVLNNIFGASFNFLIYAHRNKSA